MTELELLNRAKFYMDSLADRVNPITGEKITSDELNDERFSKCFSFISGVLGEKIRGISYQTSAQTSARSRFHLSDEEKASVTINDTPIGINTIAAHINEVIDQSSMKGVSGGKLAECLVGMGYLVVKSTDDGGHVRTATERGIAAGIITIDKTDSVGRMYRQNLYSPEMQRFLVENINEIISSSYEKIKGSPDTREHPGDADDNDDIYGIL